MSSHIAARTLSVAAFVALSTFVAPMAAHATADECASQRWSGGSDQEGWQVRCTLHRPGTDAYRAKAVCQRDTNPSSKVTVYGPWLTLAGSQWSVAKCAVNYSLYSGTKEVK
ncbi:hypothetical protein GCM10010112_40630 [Actinoplanes lobatus]|uniref:Invasion protein IalB n=1 Tax=Actinoplanes lobatus TaxID=113568 RepID=A0A7W7HNJ3_9ACTN|nr:invasion protein IalB [Actinoplanes lobatus]GGN72392.1 hypothetical protein GCM10010112_40630 [Actinoplanes lobatus]GIE42025.1 hypothetical protein Alo02nite_49230 [Actinoplanes lobatus]